MASSLNKIYSDLLDKARDDPKLFEIASKSVLNIIELISKETDPTDAIEKFKHSRELFKAEALLDRDLERKGALINEFINLIFNIAIKSLI